MIRSSWLQFRTQAAVAFGVLAVVGVVLAVTGPHLVNLYDSTVANCNAQHDCSTATTVFTNTDGPLQIFGDFLLLLLPILVGIFWGAPLVAREFETGTFRLSWTQSVTRTRWLAVKLGFGVVTSMVAAGLLSLTVSWWSTLLDQVRGDSFSPLAFGVRDIVPVGYAAFAFVLGVTAGLFARRTMPAIATALVGFVLVRFAVSSWVRPRLITPLHRNMSITASSPLSVGLGQGGVTVTSTTRGLLPGDWVYSNELVDKAGHAPTAAFLDRACPFGKASLQPNFQTCIPNIAAKFHELVTYQPTSHYWALQWYETVIFLGLTAVLACLCFWSIRRPIA